MIEEEYIVKNNFETFLFITITEICIDTAKRQKYSRMEDWCGYLGNYVSAHIPSMVLTKKPSLVAMELYHLHTSIRDKFGMSNTDSTKYFNVYFKHKLWVKYKGYVVAKQSYFGCNSQSKYNN